MCVEEESITIRVMRKSWYFDWLVIWLAMTNLSQSTPYLVSIKLNSETPKNRDFSGILKKYL